jgi:hypothetical protein
MVKRLSILAMAVCCAFLNCQQQTNNEPRTETTTVFSDDGTSGSSVWQMDKWHSEYDYYIVHDCDSAIMQTINAIYLPDIANPTTDRIALQFEYQLYINSLLGPALSAGISVDESNFSNIWTIADEGSGLAEIDISGWNDKQIYLRFLVTNLAPVDGAIIKSVKIVYFYVIE